MFDLSKNGKLKMATRLIHNMTIAGTKVLLDKINSEHLNKIPKEDIEAIPYKGPAVLKRIATYILLKVLIPLYERDLMSQQKLRQLQPKS